jgi:hypothetical protein
MLNKFKLKYQEFLFSYWLYRLLTLVSLLVLLFNVGGDTSSYKVFANLSKGLVDQNAFVRFYNLESFLENSNSIATKTNRIGGQTIYLDNNGKVVNEDKVNQEALVSRLPMVILQGVKNPNIGTVTTIAELIKPPLNPEYKSRLTFPVINVNAPIVYSNEQSVVDNLDANNPCSQSSMSQPFQQLVRKGLVHLWPSPKPGEIFDPAINVDNKTSPPSGIGSSYIAGHSSECIAHEYSRILASMQDKKLEGNYFYIWNEQGQKLSFRVFECLEVESKGAGAQEAFKFFPGRRVVTLQTSKFYTNTYINRWLCRGELDESLLGLGN